MVALTMDDCLVFPIEKFDLRFFTQRYTALRTPLAEIDIVERTHSRVLLDTPGCATLSFKHYFFIDFQKELKDICGIEVCDGVTTRVSEGNGDGRAQDIHACKRSITHK